MFKNKLNLFIKILLVGGIIFQYVSYNYNINKLTKENFKLKKENEQRIKKVRDSALADIEHRALVSKKKLDSLYSLPPKIKWKRYEKPIYIDRSLDDAIDIIAKYSYHKRAGGEGRKSNDSKEDN